MTNQADKAGVTNRAPAVAVRLPGLNVDFRGLSALIPLTIALALLVLVVYLISRTTQTLLWLSAVLWLLFIGYWSAAAGKTSAIKRSESVRSRQVHQLLMYGALVIAFIRVPGLTFQWSPKNAWIIAAGFAIQLSSAVLAISARKYLGRNWSAEIASKVDHQLVRSGPYRLIRHPIYTGMLGMFVGTAIISGELHGLVAAAMISVAYLRKIRLEEQNLQNVFGAKYDEYRERSWALIPWLI
jgi:protein-S-isoprenylcysteine O-methyltransferase Ste14